MPLSFTYCLSIDPSSDSCLFIDVHSIRFDSLENAPRRRHWTTRNSPSVTGLGIEWSDMIGAFCNIWSIVICRKRLASEEEDGPLNGKIIYLSKEIIIMRCPLLLVEPARLCLSACCTPKMDSHFGVATCSLIILLSVWGWRFSFICFTVLRVGYQSPQWVHN